LELFLHYPSERLSVLYEASGFTSPPLATMTDTFEGFRLPVLGAVNMSAAVIASNTT
jgi:hypothetical protein